MGNCETRQFLMVSDIGNDLSSCVSTSLFFH